MNSLDDSNNRERPRRHRSKRTDRSSKKDSSSSRSKDSSSSRRSKLEDRSSSDLNSSASSLEGSLSSPQKVKSSMFIPGITGRPRCLDNFVLESDDEVHRTPIKVNHDGSFSKRDPSSSSTPKSRRESLKIEDKTGIPISQLIEDIRFDKMQLLQRESSQGSHSLHSSHSTLHSSHSSLHRSGVDIARDMDDIQGFLSAYASKKPSSRHDIRKPAKDDRPSNSPCA